MSILSAQTVKSLCLDYNMIEPFNERTKHNGMTFGLSGCGYDVRLAQTIGLAAGEFSIASIIEHMEIPNTIMARVCDKSTWARRGLSVFNTVIEPGWIGYLTVELVNHSKETLIINAGDPIAQIIFERLDHSTNQPYTGKYQYQPNKPVHAIMGK